MPKLQPTLGLTSRARLASLVGQGKELGYSRVPKMMQFLFWGRDRGRGRECGHGVFVRSSLLLFWV